MLGTFKQAITEILEISDDVQPPSCKAPQLEREITPSFKILSNLYIRLIIFKIIYLRII